MTTTSVKIGKTADGREFPEYQGELLSWSIGLYNTFDEARIDYPKMRTVIRALLVYRPEQVERERREMLKASFGSLFGHNARKVLTVIEQEQNHK